jgi:lysine 2,3-aminomutase
MIEAGATNQKPPAPPEAFEHRNVRQGEFWRAIPRYRAVDEATFLDHIWQGQNSIKSPEELLATVEELVEPSFFDDVREGFARAPMAVRVSPYAIASARNSFPWPRSCGPITRA